MRRLYRSSIILAIFILLSGYQNATGFFPPASASTYLNFTTAGNSQNPVILVASPLRLEIPKTIRVRITGSQDCDLNAPYVVKTIDFKDYVKHVLPSEWNPSARQYHEVLKAGAIAIKMYAWYWIDRGGKWKDADVWDSVCDQVYNPNVSTLVTDQAVDDTWEWILTRAYQVFQTYHLQTCGPPVCMGQIESEEMAKQGHTWDEILAYFYPDSRLIPLSTLPGGFTLRFNGQTGDGRSANRVFFKLDDPQTEDPGPGLDVGDRDFTIEFWIKASVGENISNPAKCGKNHNWIYGNIILDNGRINLPSGFGISLLEEKIAFGVSGADGRSLTICSLTTVVDGGWHHVAVQRRYDDGRMWIFIDGQVEAYGNGPNGDISYPNSAKPIDYNDPYLSLGGWKQDDDCLTHPFFRGWLDELRFSTSLVYDPALVSRINLQPLPISSTTSALYHFDEGIGVLLHNSVKGATGLGFGKRFYGGKIPGPEWQNSDLFITYNFQSYLPLTIK